MLNVTAACIVRTLTLTALTVAVVSCGGRDTEKGGNHTGGVAGAAGTGGTGAAGEASIGGSSMGGAHVSSGGTGTNPNTGGRKTGGAETGGAGSGGGGTGGIGGITTGGSGGVGGTRTGGAGGTTGGTGGVRTGGSGGVGGTRTGGAGGATGGTGGDPNWVCGNARCVPGASCDSETEFCKCDPGYEGDGSWCLSTEPCDDSPCLNGGTCHPTGIDDTVLCTCPANWGGVHCEVPCSGNLTFPDPVLAAAVRREARLEEGAPIPAEVAASIQNLGIYERISDFTGLECLTSVSWVSVYEAALADLSPFAALPRLSSLSAPCNPLLDLSSLAPLINLTSLSLGQDSRCDDETGVKDISPLAGLVGLTTLDLSGHNIESLAPLSALTRIEHLILASNAKLSSLADLAPLSRLKYLVVTDTQVSDLSPLANHKALETLWLSGSMVADLTPVLSITSLAGLYIVATPVDCAAQASNLATLVSRGVDVSSSCDNF